MRRGAAAQRRELGSQLSWCWLARQGQQAGQHIPQLPAPRSARAQAAAAAALQLHLSPYSMWARPNRLPCARRYRTASAAQAVAV
jgi:hypothetical protein